MNYHQGMSSAELHIKVILQWVSQTGNWPLNPPLPEFSEIRRRQKGSEVISRLLFFFFLCNLWHWKWNLRDYAKKQRFVMMCWGPVLLCNSRFASVCSPWGIQAESFHDISPEDEEASNSIWLITWDGNLWNRSSSGARFSSQFFTPMWMHWHE